MARENEDGPERWLDSYAFQAAAQAADLGVAVEEGGSLRLLNETAKSLLLSSKAVEQGSLGGADGSSIPLDALPDCFRVPEAFRAWRESALANLPDRSEPGRFVTQAGRLLEIDFFTAGVGSDGVFAWSIRDRTTRQTVEDQLQRASESVQSTQQAKTHLLAMMSHEVRSPMNAILGMTELLLHTPLSREQWNLLDTARTAGESLIGTLDNVLDISKVESGTLPLDRRAFSLADLVEGLAEEVAPAAAEGGLEVSCYVDAEIPRILEGDPDRIRQVLTNLLGNAVKFTRQGSIALRAESFKAGPKRHWVRISVEDTGPGIQADSMDRIFDPFFQGDAFQQGDSRGVGLGLSIVQSFVDLMGGRVEVDSAPGRGTCFELRLPLAPSESQFPNRRDSDLQYPESRGIILSPSDRVCRAAAQVFSSLGVSFSMSKDPENLTPLLVEGDSSKKTMVFVDLRFGAPELDWIRQHLSLRSADLDLGLTVLVPPGFENGRPTQDSFKTFYLPKPLTRRGVAGVLQEAQGKKVAPREESPNTPLEVSELKGLRILLVEDRADNRRYLSRVLQGAGLFVDAASDGEIGLIQYKTGTYDLVLTDLDMPGMDGFRLLEMIRVTEKEEGRARVPVVAITAHTDAGIAERCFKSGMDAFVTKPVLRSELLEVVRDLVRVDPLVLVVEDDPRNLDFTCQILSGRGYRTEGVETGAEALKRVERGGVAAVLLDMTLPDISGLEVVRRIRALPEGAHLPVIGVTGHVGADQAAQCREAGCTEFVEKPVRWDSFLETLQSLISGKEEPVFTPLLDGLTRFETSGAEGAQDQDQGPDRTESGAVA